MTGDMSAWMLPGCLTLGMMAGFACDRTPEPKPVAPALPSTLPATSALDRSDAPRDFRFRAKARLVAIGDIHGDLHALRAALRLAGAIDSDDRWIGRDLTVVQTGDQLDRGDQDREVLDVLDKLELDATAAGGALYVLNGNHELMQPVLDFRYVTRKSFESFNEFSARAPAPLQQLPAAERGRAAAFLPGGPYAQKLSRRPTVAVVGDSLFAHAGVLPAHVDYGLARLNAEASGYLAGKRAELPRVLASDDSPVWTRAYGGLADAATCEKLGRVLAEVGAKRMIVGHTVQQDGINATCQGRLFRIDVGLSAFYGGNPVQVLEVTASGTRILTQGAAPSRQSAPRDSAVQSAP